MEKTTIKGYSIVNEYQIYYFSETIYIASKKNKYFLIKSSFKTNSYEVIEINSMLFNDILDELNQKSCYMTSANATKKLLNIFKELNN